MIAVCRTEDIDPITETGKHDDMMAITGDDDAMIDGQFVARFASFSSAVSNLGTDSRRVSLNHSGGEDMTRR